MQQESKTRALALLDALGIPYRCLEHEPVMTMTDCIEIDRQLGGCMCKNLFLSNRQGTEHFLLMLPGEKPFKTGAASRAMGQARLSFAPSQAMEALLGVQPGAVTPLGLMRDTQHGVRLFIDEALRGEEILTVHPCVNTASVALPMADFLSKFLPHTGHAVHWVALKEDGHEAG